MIANPTKRIVKLALLVCAGAFLFGFAMVPLYRIACEQVFGLKLKSDPVNSAKLNGLEKDESRLITVQFVSNVNSALAWEFTPEVTSMQVHPGKLNEAWFDATNKAASAIVGKAVPSVAPNTASLYFNKTECFCFTEQMLQAGESRRMPVRFFVDPKLPPEIETITLSYTFYNDTQAINKLAEKFPTSEKPTS